MGVEVTAYVEGGSVVAAGETISVSVTVSSTRDCSGDISDESDVVSWCSAQIHCICTTNESYVIAPPPAKAAAPSPPDGFGNLTSAGTSFTPWRGEGGHVVLTTKPTILFCDLHLPAGHTRSFRYREVVPVTGPPSYRGLHVKYSWKVTVGAQRHGRKVALVRLPLRVLLLPRPPPGVLEDAYSESEEELSPSNPFLHPSSSPLTSPSAATTAALLQPWTPPNARAYNIVHSLGHVVKFSIFRSSYRLGDDILATLDFCGAQVPCVQYAVCLQSVEDVSEDHRKRSSQGTAVVSYSKTHEMCLSMTHTSLLLPVPLHITPSFEAVMVNLSYRLHFEFVLSLDDSNRKAHKSKLKRTSSSGSSKGGVEPPGGGEAGPDGGGDLQAAYYGDGGWGREEDGSETWRAPSELDIETLVWDLPITVCPAPPAQLSSALNLPLSCASMVV